MRRVVSADPAFVVGMRARRICRRDMLDKGLINQQDYDDKKKQILENM